MIALAVVAALVVVVGAVAVPQWTAADEPPTLDAVVVVEKPTSAHVSDDVDYEQTPPAGGDHDPAWLECGVYDEPVRDENAVHSLEHGTVWVTHDPDLDAASVDELAERLPAESILSPYDGLPGPVVVTVWVVSWCWTGWTTRAWSSSCASSATGTPRPSRSPRATAASPATRAAVRRRSRESVSPAPVGRRLVTNRSRRG